MDSNGIKANAFYESVKPYGEAIADSFRVFCRNNWGKSRYFLFDWLIKNHFPNETPQFKKNLISAYEEKIAIDYPTARITDGTLDLLARLKHVEKHVVSGGKEEEVINLLNTRGLAKFFKTISGSPTSKEDNIRKTTYDQSKPVLFVGDSLKDFEASQVFEFDFLYVEKYSDICKNDIPNGSNVFKINSFLDIL